ncbi:MAG: glycosyltransferase family 39 protein, partial [Phycisphaerales bacterium]
MGKYIEFNSPGAYDCGANVYSAAHILAGAEIGVEEKQSASLGTLLVNLLGVWLFGYNDFGPKMVQGILQAAALVLMFIAMRRLFGVLPAAVGVIVASIYLSSPLIAKFGNDKMQYAVAAMVLSVSCFVLRQLGGKWWYAVLAGAFAAWAPLFKQTATSVIGAIGLFTVLQPLLKHRTCRQTATDILLLSVGAIAAIAPLYVWIIGWRVQTALPYAFVWQVLIALWPTGAPAEQVKPGLEYVSTARELVPFSQQWPRVLRYYWMLILPVALAVGSVIARIIKVINKSVRKSNTEAAAYDRFVPLLAVWWVLDMAFVWISPRSYEQYYLPLTASGAMLGGYLIATYRDKVKRAVHSRIMWKTAGIAGLLLMVIMSWHVFFGINRSPYSGVTYRNPVTGQPIWRNGYLQRLREIRAARMNNLKQPWEILGEYIRDSSKPADKIYVWGWWPGIYVKAQRFSSASKAFSMTRQPPQQLKELVTELLSEFEREMPKFIVDSRKRHIPTERPPYELWPIMPRGFMGVQEERFLPLDKTVIEL